MAQGPISPPPQKMVREFSLPEHKSGFFTEIVDKQSDRYHSVYPIKRGTLYSTVKGGDVNTSASFAPLYFLKETRVGSSDNLVIWSWSTELNAQDTYNLSQEWSAESTSHGIYARVYTVRRDRWDAGLETVTVGTALTSLIAIVVAAGGTGYAATDVVNIAGGGGATAELVVDSSGVIQNVIVTNDGSGYDSAALPAITITTTTGAGATLTAVVQPKTALLVHQEKQELTHDNPLTNQSNDSPYSSEFVRVFRIWEVLPGPVLTTKSFSSDARRGLTLKTTQRGQVGALEPETTAGTGILQSVFAPENSVVGVRNTLKLDTASFPIGELFIGGYDFVGLPARVPGLTHIAFCDGTTSAFVTTDDAWMSINGTGVPPYSTGSPYTIAGATLVRKRVKAASTTLCKTRRVVQYLLTHPDDTKPWEITYTSGTAKVGDIRFNSPNYEMCTVAGNPGTWGINLGPGNLGYVTQNLKHEGKYVDVNYNNVLNDAFSIAILNTNAGGTTWTGMTVTTGLGILLTDGTCNFYENYSFAATSPNASDYHATNNTDGFGGRWWFMDKKVEPLEASCWRLETREFLAPLVGY